ncbi:MAG: isocitrate/isopropylmalate dehydrogenase family protein [Candidatus Bathyarchaeia archaeon]
MYKIALIRGDGIGPEQMDATLEVLYAVRDTFDLPFETRETEAGDECMSKRGTPLPEETIKVVTQSNACLKAPVGETATDVIVRFRHMLDLYANVRPIKSYYGVPCLRSDIDFVFARENTEDVYKGLEFELPGDTAICLRVISKRSCERIARFAFELARKRNGRKSVTAVHKANVMRITDGLFAQVCREVAKSYSDIEFNEAYVDATAMRLIKEPQEFDVIVTTNLFGDILSDEAAQLVGGLGMTPAGNIGNDFALFEPVHGSAPDIAGKGIANPCSLILAAKMMFDWLGERYQDARCMEAGRAIDMAVKEALKGKIKTPDLGGKSSTKEMGDTIAGAIRSG